MTTASPFRNHRARLGAVTLAIAAVSHLTGCGTAIQPDGEPTVIDGAADTVAEPAALPDTPSSAAPSSAGDPASSSLVARPSHPVPVYAEPGDTPVATLAATTDFGSPRALLVLDQGDGWLQVALPTRPNGSTGFIAAEGVEVRSVDLTVHVSVGERRLTVVDGGEVVLDTPVAVGADDTPTPAGSFFVTDKLDTGDPAGPYGPFAFGLSAHSDVLTSFGDGDGQIGIHGTSDPASVGDAVSNGCIRVPNDVAVLLNDLLPLGAPVVVE